MNNETLADYFDALERLKNGRPNILSKHVKITNDAVSLEAGRKKGSIKKSRSIFKDLLAEIEAAAIAQSQPARIQVEHMKKVKMSSEALREQLDAALGRELSLLSELFEVKKKLAQLTGEKIIPLRKQTTKN